MFDPSALSPSSSPPPPSSAASVVHDWPSAPHSYVVQLPGMFQYSMVYPLWPQPPVQMFALTPLLLKLSLGMQQPSYAVQD